MIKCLLMIPVIRDAHLSKSPPLGLAYIASSLEKNGISVEIIDSPSLGLSRAGVLAQVKRFKPDFVGMSVTMQSYKSACQHIREIKKILPKCKFVFGGPIVTFESEQIMREMKDLDFCLRGEGEEAMIDLIHTCASGKPLKNVLGLTWRKGKVIKNDDRKLIHDLDQLPFPAWHLLPMDVYRGPADLGGGKPFATMIASRGCIFKCRFCAARVLWKTQRRRKVECVLDEMEILFRRYKIRYLHFPDDLLLANRAYALELCQGIVSRGLQKIRWSCNGRVSLIDKELLLNLKKAGCVCLYYGIESGNQTILDRIDKGITLRQIEKTVNLTRNMGLRVSGSFLVGYPDESKETIRKTVDFAIKLDLDYASFHLVVPYPGTPLFAECQKKGLLLSNRWEDYILDIYGEPNTSVIKLEHLTNIELSKLYRQANKRFTLRPSYLWKILKLHPHLCFRRVFIGLFVFARPQQAS